MKNYNGAYGENWLIINLINWLVINRLIINRLNYKINNKTTKNATTISDFWAQNAENNFCSQGFFSDSLGLSS